MVLPTSVPDIRTLVTPRPVRTQLPRAVRRPVRTQLPRAVRRPVRAPYPTGIVTPPGRTPQGPGGGPR
ncbi:hypothetical protein [Streptomyces mesophilus]|uniref:hypothetical protein n=1 Tax=Streptomyces mesophilus TaxID=1775132 RepID=UPI00331B4027